MSFRDDYIVPFDVEGYVGRHGTVKRSNKRNVMVVPCLICGDTRRNKFYIDTSGGETNGLWNSYCCHDNGNLVDLVVKAEGMSSKAEAISLIKAEVDGTDDLRLIPLIDASVPAPAAAPTAPTFDLPKPFWPASPDTQIAFKGAAIPLRDRGVDEYIIARHQLQETGFMAEWNGRPRYDLAKRLVIPVVDHDDLSRLLSWQARDLTGMAERKYLFPTDDKTSQTLYGIHQARGLSTLTIVEGVFHKWAIDRLGRDMGRPEIENMAVASFGKKLSKAQIDLLLRSGVKRVILAWDLDAAPQIHKAAQLLNGKVELRIALPSRDGRDLDELSKIELMETLVSAEPYSFSLAARLNAALISGHM